MRYRLLLLVFMLASMTFPLQAEPRLIAGEAPLFCYMQRDKVRGVACDLLREMAQRVGYSGELELMPFKRALYETRHTQDALMVPVTRTSERDPDYQWLAEILQEEFLLAALRGSQVDISNFGAARKLNIGVLIGGASAQIIKDQRLLHVQGVYTEELNVRKLAAGRIDAWLGSWNVMRQAQRDIGYPDDALRRGAVAARVRIYLAGSPGLGPLEAAKWLTAFKSMQDDGVYARILERYRYQQPPEQ
ncbi:transporter substrate-binding domain-containing protein [Hahella aquimaris]|uniref:substrate-binding periplasmic protein n=1 Tax=Hahella sp. HNIBRBA332 TaxID=3015983 RepID=UPI00273C0346|nr:transporter substrate-binding domain-containing protein [Hahella sp. HNIBRBA332]WLQ16101.1 transporter substrate-binding domain-containing protein [Hahella sp. HNIBRBA332]